MITPVFNNELKAFRLDTDNSSYVIQISDEGYIFHSYYGERINDFDLIYLQPRAASASFSANIPNPVKGGYTLDTRLLEYPTNGIGDMRETALAIRGKNGSAVTDIRYEKYEIIKGKKPLEGLPASYDNGDECETLEITAKDNLTGAVVILSYSVFPKYDAIARSAKIINNSDSTFTLERVLSACYDFPKNDFDFVHLYGAWAKERRVERFPLHHGTQSIASRRGSSSHNHTPFAALAQKNADEDSGEVFGFTFIYSGNFLFECEVDTFSDTRLCIGINPTDFMWKLAPNETFTTPEVLSVYSSEGIGQMSRNFHKFIRNNICRGKYKTARRPILVNNWEATYFNFDEEKLYAIAKDASELGIEMLVMDDGWFGVRNSDNCSLGDWFVNEKKLKGGLKPLVDRINGLGMKFGIWFEPEMISPDSDLYRAHPDWCLHVDGRDCSIGRQQLVLDMSRKDVRDNLFEQMSKILSSANIAYVKWDFNRNLTEAGSALLDSEHQCEIYHRYVLGVYELLERLLKAFPDLLLEGCSGGGGRFDAGMLYYSPQYWTSDNTDALDRVYIQWGTMQVFPSSAMSAHVSAIPNHQTGRTESMKTRGHVAMGGAFGYELDITKLNDTDKASIKEQVKEYTKYYELVNFGDYYRLISPYDGLGTQCAWQFVSEDKAEALVTCVMMKREVHNQFNVFPKGLKPDSVYTLSFSSGEERTLHGSTIMKAGLPVNLGADADSVIIHIVEK